MRGSITFIIVLLNLMNRYYKWVLNSVFNNLLGVVMLVHRKLLRLTFNGITNTCNESECETLKSLYFCERNKSL